MKISFSKIELPSSGAIVVGVYEDRKLTPTAAQLDKQTKGAIERALAASRFAARGKAANKSPSITSTRPTATMNWAIFA